MTREDFSALTDGDIVDVLDANFRRSGVMRKVLRRCGANGIIVEWPESKKGHSYISNELRVERWNSDHNQDAVG